MALCAGYIITSSASMPNSISSFFFFTFFCSSYWCLGVVFECHCYFSLSCVTHDLFFQPISLSYRLDTNNSESNIVIALWISYFLVFSKDIFWFNFFAIPFFFWYFSFIVRLLKCHVFFVQHKGLVNVSSFSISESLSFFFFWLIDEKEPKRQLLSIRTIESKKRMEYGVPV